MTTLETLIHDDELDLSSLQIALATGDVPLATVTDEVLLLCGRNPLAPPRRHWTPWLASHDDEAVAVARATASRFLVAKGLAWPDDGDRLRLAQPLDALSWALSATIGVVTVDSQVLGDTVHRAGAFVLPDGVVLHDDQEPELGLHHLTFRDQSTEALWLAAMLDPTGAATTTDDPILAERLDELIEGPEDLPGELRSRCVAARSTLDRDRPDQGRLQAVTGVGTSTAWWLMQERTEPEAWASVQQVDTEGVLGVATALLDPADD